MNMKGQAGSFFGLLIAVAIIGLLVWAVVYAGSDSPSVSIDLRFDHENIRNGQTTNLYVTITNTGTQSIDGTLNVTTPDGAEYLAITTNEQSALLLPAKGSSVTRVYAVQAQTGVKVIPNVQATVTSKTGVVLGHAAKSLTLTP